MALAGRCKTLGLGGDGGRAVGGAFARGGQFLVVPEVGLGEGRGPSWLPLATRSPARGVLRLCGLRDASASTGALAKVFTSRKKLGVKTSFLPRSPLVMMKSTTSR